MRISFCVSDGRSKMVSFLKLESEGGVGLWRSMVVKFVLAELFELELFKDSKPRASSTPAKTYSGSGLVTGVTVFRLFCLGRAGMVEEERQDGLDEEIRR